MNESITQWLHGASDYWNRLEFGRENRTAWVAAFVAMLLAALWIYRRDAREVGRAAKIWLTGLRLLVLAVLLIIALQPQIPNNKLIVNPSRVGLLVDTSLSMSIADKPAVDPATPNQSLPRRARVEAIEKLLSETSLIDDLRATHDLAIYTFDSKLIEQQRLSRIKPEQLPEDQQQTSESETTTVTETEPPIDWKTVVAPQGLETRMGEALLDVIRREAGATLSGIVIVTDGVSNTGVEPTTAVKAAVGVKAKLFPIGIGSTEHPVNLQVADVQCPTNVHVRDGFTITAHVRGQGLADKDIRVELLSKPEGAEGEPVLVDEDVRTLEADGEPMAFSFDYIPNEPGRREFFLRARPVEAIEEMIADDNESKVSIDINERKVRVLLIAGGPMRDYRFVRNLLYRDSSIELNVWLQTGAIGISQESDELLFDFPKSREELFEYDVIIGFDPDWSRIPDQQINALSEWVFDHAGGLILIAGDVYTPATAEANAGAAGERIRELYPVVLESQIFEPQLSGEEFQQPWKLALTDAGLAAGFLQLDENPATSANLWNEFPGVFRAYPTTGVKAGATVFAYFADPRFGDGAERPVLLASQFYGAGRVLYLGSAEIWRLRALDENFYDRFWVQAVREVGQGRLMRGTTRGVLFLERDRYPLGSTVQVQARILDAQLQKLEADHLVLEVYDPNGKPITPAIQLNSVANRPGDFQGGFPVTRAGTYRLELPVPESNEQIVKRIEVQFPNLERQHPQQDVQVLRSMARETGGEYLTATDAAKRLPALLKDQSITTVQTGFPDPQWDKAWVMYLLVGLLGMEWLTRKLLKLA